MNNSKEVVILIIMILVVLVTAAKADEEYPDFITEYTPDVLTVQRSNLDMESFITAETWIADEHPGLKVGVTSISNMSNVDDDYGLVVTLKTLF